MEHDRVTLCTSKSTCARPGRIGESVRVHILCGGRDRAVGTDMDRGRFRTMDTIASAFALDVAIVFAISSLPKVLLWHQYRYPVQVSRNGNCFWDNCIRRSTRGWHIQDRSSTSYRRIYTRAAIDRTLPGYIPRHPSRKCTRCRSSYTVRNTWPIHNKLSTRYRLHTRIRGLYPDRDSVARGSWYWSCGGSRSCSTRWRRWRCRRSRS